MTNTNLISFVRSTNREEPDQTASSFFIFFFFGGGGINILVGIIKLLIFFGLLGESFHTF